MYKKVTWDKPKVGLRFETLETLIASALLEAWHLDKIVLHTKNGIFTIIRG